jgi:surface protein
MFAENHVFNQNLAVWNVASVKDLSYMFNLADFFNQNISEWNTARVIGIYGLFSQAVAFNTDISKWNTARLTNMDSVCCYGWILNECTFQKKTSMDQACALPSHACGLAARVRPSRVEPCYFVYCMSALGLCSHFRVACTVLP